MSITLGIGFGFGILLLGMLISSVVIMGEKLKWKWTARFMDTRWCVLLVVGLLGGGVLVMLVTLVVIVVGLVRFTA